MAKMRPNLIELFLTTLATWNGSQLISQSASAQKSANKALRIVLMHLSRYAIQFPSPFGSGSVNIPTGCLKVLLSDKKSTQRLTQSTIVSALLPVWKSKDALSHSNENGLTPLPRMRLCHQATQSVSSSTMIRVHLSDLWDPKSLSISISAHCQLPPSPISLLGA